MRPAMATLFLATLLPGAARAEAPWEVRLEVAAPGHQEQARITVSGTWLGEERELQLADHGADPRDLPGDEVWFGAWQGPPVRSLPLQIEAQLPGRERAVVYEGTERIEGPEDRLTWELVEEDGRLRALRVARPRTGATAPLGSELVQTVAAGLWALLLLNLAGWLWWGRGERP